MMVAHAAPLFRRLASMLLVGLLACGCGDEPPQSHGGDALRAVPRTAEAYVQVRADDRSSSASIAIVRALDGEAGALATVGIGPGEVPAWARGQIGTSILDPAGERLAWIVPRDVDDARRALARVEQVRDRRVDDVLLLSRSSRVVREAAERAEDGYGIHSAGLVRDAASMLPSDADAHGFVRGRVVMDEVDRAVAAIGPWATGLGTNDAAGAVEAVAVAIRRPGTSETAASGVVMYDRGRLGHYRLGSEQRPTYLASLASPDHCAVELGDPEDRLRELVSAIDEDERELVEAAAGMTFDELADSLDGRYAIVFDGAGAAAVTRTDRAADVVAALDQLASVSGIADAAGVRRASRTPDAWTISLGREQAAIALSKGRLAVARDVGRAVRLADADPDPRGSFRRAWRDAAAPERVGAALHCPARPLRSLLSKLQDVRPAPARALRALLNPEDGNGVVAWTIRDGSAHRVEARLVQDRS